jgi:hypothetical protein
VVVLAGVAVLTGVMWARVAGVCLAGLSPILNITFLVAYPFWLVVVITLDVLIIYALTINRRELKPLRPTGRKTNAVSAAGRVLDHAVFLLVDPVALLAVQDNLRHLPQPRPERLG